MHNLAKAIAVFVGIIFGFSVANDAFKSLWRTEREVLILVTYESDQAFYHQHWLIKPGPRTSKQQIYDIIEEREQFLEDSTGLDVFVKNIEIW